jgi:hypothetical protein
MLFCTKIEGILFIINITRHSSLTAGFDLNSGQMMLSIAGILFLSMLIINVHKGTGNRITGLASNESVIQATALAEGIFEEIQSRAFDEETISKPCSVASDLTGVFSLGEDASENATNKSTFDDIDDYDNFTGTDTSGVMGDFDYRIDVYYVEEGSPGTDSSSRTFLKRVRVAIENQYLPATLTFYRLISY